MKTVLTFLIFTLFTSSNYELIRTIPTKALTFEVDPLGDVYLNDSSFIEKHHLQSKLISKYDPMVYGEISSVDVSNPMKVLVFYRDLQTIIWLDNFMSPHSDPVEISFKYSGNITCAAYSKNNHIWFYHQSNQQLIRCDLELNEVSKSNPMNNFMTGEIQPEVIKEYKDIIYIFDRENRVILTFDIFGTFIKKINIPSGVKSICWEKDNVIVSNGIEFFMYNTNTFIESILTPPESGFDSGIISSNKMYLKQKNALNIYSIQKK